MKITWLQFLIYALATFRLALLVSKESGPAFIFRKLRRLPPPKSSAKEGLSCEWCMSMWAAMPIAAFAAYGGALNASAAYAVEAFLLMLALSACGIIVNQAFTRGK